MPRIWRGAAAEFGVVLGGDGRRRHEDASRRGRTLSCAAKRDGVEEWLTSHAQLHGLQGPGAVRIAAPDQGRRRTSSTADKIFINVGGRAERPGPAGRRPGALSSPTAACWSSTCCRGIWSSSAAAISGWSSPRCIGGSAAEVTVVEMGPRLIQREDEEVSAAIKEILEAEGIQVRLAAECIRFEPRGSRYLRRRRLRATASRRSSDRTCCWPSAAVRTPTISAWRRPASRSTSAATSWSTTHLRTNVAGHLGAGRLQRQRRVHPHRLQRLRDRRRQSARWRAAPGQRPHHRLRPLHRSAARPRRPDRGRGAGRGQAAPGRAPPDDRGRPRRREGRDAGLHEDRRRRRHASRSSAPRSSAPAATRRSTASSTPCTPRRPTRRCSAPCTSTRPCRN